jgi:tetratricopeptide (TPR) repeat protein
LRSSRLDAARVELERVPPGALLHAEAERLLGWLALGDAAQSLRKQQLSDARVHLAVAARYWPGADGALANLPGRDQGLLGILVRANHRPRVKEALLEASRRAGFADPKSCHRLAIFHLAEGHACIEKGQFKEAISEWEAAIGHLAVVVANRAYMESWRHSRGTTYNFVLEPDPAFDETVMAFCKTLFETGAERLKNEAATSRNPQRRDLASGAAETVTQLPLMLEAELDAARMLATHGGFEHEGRNLVFGPTMLAGSGLEAEFSEYCTELDRVNLERFLDNPDGEILGASNEIERFFSSLRIPTLLLRKKEFDAARKHFDTPGWACFPICEMSRCNRGPVQGCRGSGRRFSACNPAFVRDNGAEDLQFSALDLQLTRCLQLADREIRKPQLEVQQLEPLWRQCAELGKNCGRAEEVTSQISGLVRGRLSELLKSDQLELAHAMLSAAYAACPDDEELQGELALLTNRRGVKLLDKGDFAAATEMLRRAYGLGSHRPAVNNNLIWALRRFADSVFTADADNCFKLLSEAHDVAVRCLREAGHEDMAGVVANLELEIMGRRRRLASDLFKQDETRAARHLRTALEFGMQCARTVNTGDVQVRQFTADVAEELAVVLAGIGIGIANAGKDLPKAMNLLRAARMFDPASSYVIKNLVAILNSQGIKVLELLQVAGIGARGGYAGWDANIGPGSSRFGSGLEFNEAAILAVSAELMEEAQAIGQAWLNHNRDNEVRDLVKQVSQNLSLVKQRQTASVHGWRGQESAEALRKALTGISVPAQNREALANPMIERGLAMLRERELMR